MNTLYNIFSFEPIGYVSYLFKVFYPIFDEINNTL